MTINIAEFYLHLQNCLLLLYGSIESKDPLKIVAMLIILAKSGLVELKPNPRETPPLATLSTAYDMN